MYNCLIIDDEKHIIDTIAGFIAETDCLQVKHTALKPEKALNLLATEEYDIVFCDIKMRNISGMEIVKQYKHKTLFIMNTAYTKYAIEGFDNGVVDFLVKPTTYARFMQAVQKAISILETKKLITTDAKPIPDYLFVKTDQKGNLTKVAFDDILYVESKKNYVSFVLANKTILSLLSLKELQTKLPAEQFIRVHMSYIVSVPKILQITGAQIHLNNCSTTIPIGVSYKDAVFTKLSIV